MKTRAEIVVIGGGIAGASVALHLAELGRRDVLVLEQSELVSGTTSHAPGLVGQLRSSVSLTRLLMDSVAQYRAFSFEGAAGFHPVGSLRLASSRERLEEIGRQHAFAQRCGLETHLLDPGETKRLFPLITTEALEGALLVPSDGSAVAPILARAMIERATALGVTFAVRSSAQAIETVGGAVRRVSTNQGTIETETVVVTGGIWSPRLGKLAGVPLALVPMQHQYVVTASLPELSGVTLPNLRDPDRRAYVRQRDSGLVIGGYEPNPKSVRVEAIPDRPDPTVLGFDEVQFAPIWSGACARLPALSSAAVARKVNGLESFTPDGEFVLGPAPNLRGFWAACGFCAHGISSAGGVGKALATWIVEGEPPVDLAAMRLDRFGPNARDPRWIEEHAAEVYSTYYSLLPHSS